MTLSYMQSLSMVTGVFKTEIPCLAASPDLGLTWASKPLGNSITIPEGIIAKS